MMPGQDPSTWFPVVPPGSVRAQVPAGASASFFNMTPVVQQMLEDAGIGREDPSTSVPYKAVVPQGSPPQDSFKCVLPNVSTFLSVIETMKLDEVCTVTASQHGLQFDAQYFHGSMAMTATFTREVFAAFACEHATSITVDMNLMYKLLKQCMSDQPTHIQFTHSDSSLVLTTKSKTHLPSQIKLHGLNNDTMQDIDLSQLEYPLVISLNAKELATRITSMPATFCMYIDVDGKRLCFEGQDDGASIHQAIAIPSDVMAQAAGMTGVSKYRAFFNRSYMKPIEKGCKLAEQVQIGLHEDLPLYAQYVLLPSRGCDHAQDSKLSIYISSRME